jgi:predicted dehydrogenase
MIRTAIVGCGKIADQHVQAIARLRDCAIVAVCDREPLMAEQLAERFRIPGVFADVHEMLRTTTPDVVHITTPPQSHFTLAAACLDRGSHVYLEKPFTVTAAETDALIDLARRRGRLIAAGHNYQFTLEMLEMRRLVAQGFLGGPPVHLESHWSYDLSDVNYLGPILGNRRHWVRQLPGQLLHNVISHGIARLAEFLDDTLTDVIARATRSSRLRSLGGDDVLDELRVMIRDARGTTAFFCFSTSITPGLNQFRVCGPSNSIVVDLTSGSLILNRARNDKSYLTYFAPPLRSAREHLRNARVNVVNFLRQRLHQDFGMKELIGRFYQAIDLAGPPPIPYREIALTARIMDEIFLQLSVRHDAHDPAPGRNDAELVR